MIYSIVDTQKNLLNKQEMVGGCLTCVQWVIRDEWELSLIEAHSLYIVKWLVLMYFTDNAFERPCSPCERSQELRFPGLECSRLSPAEIEALWVGDLECLETFPRAAGPWVHAKNRGEVGDVPLLASGKTQRKFCRTKQWLLDDSKPVSRRACIYDEKESRPEERAVIIFTTHPEQQFTAL